MCVSAYKYESPTNHLFIHKKKKKKKVMVVERGSGKSLKQMLKRCSSLGKKSTVHVNFNDVPKGHFVVYVGLSRSRHIIPISFLTHPIFKMLLRQSEEEFGFYQDNGLTIPCDEDFFLSLISSINQP